MSIIGLISSIVLLLVSIAYIFGPLLMKVDLSAGSFRNRQRERALTYYERVLRNIRDLDDDLATDKIIQVEYDIERERWMTRGVELLRMLEQLDDAQNIVDDMGADDAEIDAAIEQAISDGQVEQVSASVA